MLGSQAEELWSGPGDGDLFFLVFYGDYDVPFLVVAEHFGTSPPEPVEGLWGGVAVGVVSTYLDHGYLGRKAAEKERRR